MRRSATCWLVAGLMIVFCPACSDDDGAGSDATAGIDAQTGVDGAPGTDGTTPGPDGAPVDAGPPADCSAITNHADWTVCESGPGYCAAVFTDGAGCAAVCTAVGMVCGATYEDVDGQCAADTYRAELSCANPSGHGSDYCLCVDPAACTPDCTGRECGSNGCGGSCGPCAQDCVGGTCGGEVEDCTSYPYRAATLLSERVGFGAGATGGDPTNVYLVTTDADGGPGSLRDALESVSDYWIAFDIDNATIVHNTQVNVQSNKTVDGRGKNILVEGELRIQDAHNVILSDIRVKNELEGHCTQAGDVILLRGPGGASPSDFDVHDVWIHHVEGFLGGDGLVDIRGGTNVTISWSHFHDHKKLMLMWQDENGDPVPGMRVTFHHNFFDRITLRGPQFIYGWAHFFNNYQFNWYEYGAGSLGGAQMYSEQNIYEARPGTVCIPACPDPNPCGDNDYLVSKEALVTDWGGNGVGNSISVGDLALNDAVITETNPQSVFDPSGYYSYTADPASPALAAQIAAEAGPRVDYCQ